MGWVQENPIFAIITIVFLLSQVAIVILYGLWKFYKKRLAKIDNPEMSEKEKKRAERHRRKEIRRKKRRAKKS